MYVNNLGNAMPFNIEPVINSPYKIKPALDSFPIKQKVLTDDIISAIRASVLKKENRSDVIAVSIITSLEVLAAHLKTQIPIVGESFSNATQQLRQQVDNFLYNQFTEYDYLTGNGPVGSLIKEQIQFHRLFSEIPVDMFHSCELEYEYNVFFNYHPVPKKNVITEPNKNTTTYSYNEEFLNMENSLKKYVKLLSYLKLKLYRILEQLIVKDTKIVISNHGNSCHISKDVINDGIYCTSYSEILCLAIEVDYRDTKVRCMCQLTDSGRTYYQIFHRTEGVWVDLNLYYFNGLTESIQKKIENLMSVYDTTQYNFSELENKFQSITLNADLINKIKDYKFESTGEESQKSLIELKNLLSVIEINDLSNILINHEGIEYRFCNSDFLYLSYVLKQKINSWDNSLKELFSGHLNVTEKVSTNSDQPLENFIINRLQNFLDTVNDKILAIKEKFPF